MTCGRKYDCKFLITLGESPGGLFLGRRRQDVGDRATGMYLRVPGNKLPGLSLRQGWMHKIIDWLLVEAYMVENRENIGTLNGQALEELDTARDFIRWGASRFNQAGLFFGHGTEDAIDEAIVLVLHGLHLPHGLADEFLRTRITRDEKIAVLDLLQRRIRERVPAANLKQMQFEVA